MRYGYHRCTQLCSKRWSASFVPGAVLDVGSGSGIRPLPRSRWAPRGRLATSTRMPLRPAFFVGSVDAVRSNTFDLVVANINEE
jgi:ribosomal protein L11 methylase PrmA